jgi:methyl coenzyme M reductase beta subunit
VLEAEPTELPDLDAGTVDGRAVGTAGFFSGALVGGAFFVF